MVPPPRHAHPAHPHPRPGPPPRRPHGPARHHLRLRPPDRRPLPPLRHPHPPRPARIRLPPHAPPHPAALRPQRRRDRTRHRHPRDHTGVLEDLFAYFHHLTATRRAHPTTDLASQIANARIDGHLLDDNTAASYYILIATAGHDTTTSTIAGGLEALIRHPEQLRRLRDDPALLPSAVEEMIRWVSPVKAFMRTAAADTQVRGVPIGKGESVLLSYPSANRDEDVFGEPFRFDAGREPNRHLAFGFGVHYCLGAALARMEAVALFGELLPRLASIELDGEPAWTATTFVGGLKRLPVRYSLT
ncbi:cytochrome P450 [Nonomuraea rubra]|uniref:cytochrome P450 n=1 Tax=Nonomuraea rubra TaxID=46180 RepID=UPI00360AEFA7